MNSPQQSNQDRVIRVFVSSTFRDMHGERNFLVKYIFPQLRKLCEIRGVSWGEVDLRWGVTDEQKAEGKVLPICLEEIKRCRPFFIGILGNRYGWVPDEIPQDLLEREEWLKTHNNHSVTELEILHGVLRNPEMTKHAFFYFRDHRASLKVEEELKRDADYKPEPEKNLKKLSDLKETIKRKGFPCHDNYTDPKALGEMVLQDMTAVIDRLYPEGSQPDPLDRDVADHEAFAQSRSRVYIGREDYFTRLDEFVNEAGQPIVITGESGSGKSALVSNWAVKFREARPEVCMLMHFIGASSYSADWTLMLRRLMGEFKRKFNIQQEIPDKPDELRSAFSNWLSMVSAKSRAVLVIDALNQLEDRDGAPDLVWLPPVIPSNIRIILSTLPGRSFDEIKKRGWRTLPVEPLNENERSLFIGEYLRQYTKTLSPDLVQRIAFHKQTANPLFLQSLLEELRLFGRHEELEKHIAMYLEAETVPGLYRKILARYEEDYEAERQGLVRDMMTYLWGSRRGLQESELQDLLGAEGNPLPRAAWTPLLLAAEHSLINRSGLINFSHEYFRTAVQEKYIPSEKEQRIVHLHLAGYFVKSYLSTRNINELPWQLTQAKAWQVLNDLLSQSDFVKEGWKTNIYDIKTYWASLEENSVSMTDTYRHVIENPEKSDFQFVWIVSVLMAKSGYTTESLKLFSFLKDKSRESSDRNNYKSSLLNMGSNLLDLARFNEAMELFRELENICIEMGDKAGLSDSYHGQAEICFVRGEIDKAMSLLKEQERLCRELGYFGLSSSLNSQARILDFRGQFDEAMTLLKEDELICLKNGNITGLSATIANRALILKAHGEIDEAMRLHKEQEKIARELGDKLCVALSLGNQALILDDKGEHDAAMKLHKEQEKICREIGNKNGLIISLGNQAVILKNLGQLEEAMKLHREEERICREMQNKNHLASSLNNQALILKALGNLDEAVNLNLEQERICREMGDRIGLLRALGNKALIFEDLGKFDEALKLYKEKELICIASGNNVDLQSSLGNQALIYYNRGDLDMAVSIFKEQEKVCRDHGILDGLKDSINNLAAIYYKLGKLDEAITQFYKQEKIFRETGDKDGLRLCLLNQAGALLELSDNEIDQGNMAAVETCLEKVSQILDLIPENDSEKQKFNRSLSVKYDKTGDVSLSHGDYDGAIAIFSESMTIREQMAAASPDDPDCQRNLGVSYWKIAAVCDQYRIDEAGKWWRKVNHQFSSMKDRGILDPSDETALEFSRTQEEKYGYFGS
jgi:tetratricopeptide (TPR) repeat protein